MKSILLIVFLLINYTVLGQDEKKPTINEALEKFDFLEGKIIQETDTLIYYLKEYDRKPRNLVLFIQGTDANPIFSYKIKDGKSTISRWFGDDFKELDETYTFAIVPKPGMEGVFDEDNIKIPVEFYTNNHRSYRVNQLSSAIDDIVDKHLQQPGKIIVYGHSEGAVVGAALAKVNKNITHLGFWSGNVLNNFYEFALFNRIEALKGQQSDSLAHANVMGILEWYKNVIANPNDTSLDHFGFTNKRWSSYEEAPIYDLLSLDIPIFAMFGTKDESTPIETAYLLPVQFMQNRKNNLTFEVCMECDHSYRTKENEKIESHWNDIFKDFMKWTQEE